MEVGVGVGVDVLGDGDGDEDDDGNVGIRNRNGLFGPRCMTPVTVSVLNGYRYPRVMGPTIPSCGSNPLAL